MGRVLIGFADLRDRKGWPYSRQHTRRLEIAGRIPAAMRPGGPNGPRMWWEDEFDAALEALRAEPAHVRGHDVAKARSGFDRRRARRSENAVR